MYPCMHLPAIPVHANNGEDVRDHFEAYKRTYIRRIPLTERSAGVVKFVCPEQNTADQLAYTITTARTACL